jgi:hypothetical protein
MAVGVERDLDGRMAETDGRRRGCDVQGLHRHRHVTAGDTLAEALEVAADLVEAVGTVEARERIVITCGGARDEPATSIAREGLRPARLS